MVTQASAVDRDRLKLALAVTFAIAGGIAVGLRPTATFVVVAVVAGAAACVLLPQRHLPVLLMAITIVMPSLVLEGIAGLARPEP